MTLGRKLDIRFRVNHVDVRAKYGMTKILPSEVLLQRKYGINGVSPPALFQPAPSLQELPITDGRTSAQRELQNL
jgi:hypothetical protein